MLTFKLHPGILSLQNQNIEILHFKIEILHFNIENKMNNRVTPTTKRSLQSSSNKFNVAHYLALQSLPLA